MPLADIANCLSELGPMLQNVTAGNLTHAVEQIRVAVAARMQDVGNTLTTTFERRIEASVTSAAGNLIPVTRVIDVVVERLNGLVSNIEVKTGGRSVASIINDADTRIQLINDAVLATQGRLQNIWRLTSVEMDEQAQNAARTMLTRMREAMLIGGFSEDQIRQAVGSFRFVDSLGRVLQAEMTAAGPVFRDLLGDQRAILQRIIEGMRAQGLSEADIRTALANMNFPQLAARGIQAELNESGELIFRNAMNILLGADGTMAQTAVHAAGNSPNFAPAMNVLFGPGGKVADAAHDAVQGADLTQAMHNLEEKVEQGVGGALNEAGDRARAAAAQSVGSRITGAVTQIGQLGNAMTAIPQLHQSVVALGEAWRRPHRTTADYMALMAAAGTTLTQGVQVFQALAAVTQIAAAAQAVLNAVMAINPIVLIVMAVIALIAGIVLLIVYWDRVKAALRDNPWLTVAVALFGIVGIIILVIAYWDEIKLAVLRAANFISIQVQRIGQFFAGVGRLAGQVWDYIVASAVNMGIGIANTFIGIFTQIQNFFIGVINAILRLYNEVATSAIGEFVGLEAATLRPEVDVQTRLIPPREVPQINVDAAFRSEQVTGGLEERIAAQEGVVQRAHAEDERRRAQRERDRAREEAAAAAPAAGEAPTGLPSTAAAARTSEARPELPALPPAAAAGAAGAVDSSVTVNGGITVNINAERLEANAAQLLSDQMINAIQQRLSALRSEQNFRTGVRAPAPA